MGIDQERVSPDAVNKIILDICSERYITIAVLSEILQRKPETLRGQYLTRLVRLRQLVMAFPKTPSNPRQAYKKS